MMFYIAEAAKQVGLTAGRIKDLIANGVITAVDGKIPDETINRMLDERREFISLLEYAVSHSNERFVGQAVKDRRALVDVLEDNGFFGLQTLDWTDLITGVQRDELFFRRADIQELDSRLAIFFRDYGLSPKEIVHRNMSMTAGREHTKKILFAFMEQESAERPLTPAFAEFAVEVLQAPDISEMLDQDVVDLLGRVSTKSAKQLAAQYLTFAKDCERSKSVSYGSIIFHKSEPQAVTAYPDETYLRLATCVFNAEYIVKHDMLEKALNNHLYAEMWLYVALHFVCGWRADDICKGWKYLRLYDRPSPIADIRIDTLADDILHDRIPAAVLETICEYCVSVLAASEQLPSKTAAYDPLPLEAVITPALRPFFGLLTLVAECHRLKSEDGYMVSTRRPSYQNKVNLGDFFGREIVDVLQGENLHSRRLNKTYLQGIEDKARQTGCGGVLASAVASYARNHRDLGSIRTYLQDHTWHGENAETVLFFMLDRGVFGFEIYQALLTGYPDLMSKLSLAEQNKIIKALNVKPIYLEQQISCVSAANEIQRTFTSGDSATLQVMLDSMFAISQGRGQSKDAGVGCLRRACGLMCEIPTCESCIENACPHTVFTEHGYKSLLAVLKDYLNKAYSGDKKAEAILRTVLIPRFQYEINQLFKRNKVDLQVRTRLKKMLSESLERRNAAS